MRTVKYVVWQDDDFWLGYLEECPECWTQGETQDDLIRHLIDRHFDASAGRIPGIRKLGEATLL